MRQTRIGREIYRSIDLIYIKIHVISAIQCSYSILSILELNKCFVYLRAHSEHVQVIRSNIGPESVEKCRDVQNEPI
jgi:hypothetical protein